VTLTNPETKLLAQLLRGEEKKSPMGACVSLVRKGLAAWREPDGYLVLTAAGKIVALEVWPDVNSRHAQAAEERWTEPAVSAQMSLGLPDTPRGPRSTEVALARVLTASCPGNADALAQVVMQSYPDGRGLATASPGALEAIGLAPTQAEAVAASFGLARACRQGYDPRRVRVDTSADMARAVFLQEDVADLEIECMWVGAMDQSRQITLIERVAQGKLNQVDVAMRDLFTPLCRVRAAAFFLAHNHPSGNLRVSDGDVRLTQRAIAQAELMGIEFVDHVVIAPSGEFVSIDQELM